MASLQEVAVSHVSALATGGAIDSSAAVTLHFHPDRMAGDRPILDAMRRDGVYRSQFETGTSNGGLTAFPGGDRWAWESRIFGAAYDTAPATARPKYGSLNFRHRPHGGSPRFGSAYLRLTPHALARATFCYPDSVLEPTLFGVAGKLSALVEAAEADQQDLLDDYIEAHVHGPLLLDRDVAALVLDPCYRGTEVERAAPCPVDWHPGYRLHTDVLREHPDYRGPEFVELGLHLARDGWLDPRIIGDAARTGRYDEQSLKRVWHYVARFGRVTDRPGTR